MTKVTMTITQDFGAAQTRDPEGVVFLLELNRRTAAQGACLGAAN
tara:strand:+ start:172 stop:306 length:135 start_codon:yes stop_codon:yes gene_type:complete